jgi:flagellar hook-associated protein 2
MELNVSNLSVDKNGRVSFSGLNSNIDFRAVVDSIITAKKVPADLLQTQVDSNKNKVAALGDLKTLLSSVKTSLSTLYGAVSIGNTKNIFESKEAFASSSRYDGATASSAGNLIGVTVTNSAPVGSHSIEVLQTAKAHKISTDQYNSTTTAIGFSNTDKFTIATTDENGDPLDITISLSSGDTLLSVRDRINSANTGTTPTGVSASIVSVSSSEHYLVLTKTTTGEAITLTETSGTPLQDLGIFTAGSAIKNQLQAAQTAKLYADGLLDQTNTLYESDFQTASTAAPSTGGTLTFTRDSDSAALGSFAYTTADDLADIAALINANITDVTAEVVTDGAGVRLEITGAAGFSMSDSGTAVADLGIDNKRRLIERTTNTVDDLFSGITLSLYQAEAGTTINLDVERNLGTIRTAITDFVDSYNELRRFINDQRNLETTTTDDEEIVTSGLLFNSQALQQADAALSRIVGAGVSGVNTNFSVLAQIGIDFIGLSPNDPLDANTLVVTDEELDEALLNNVEDIKRLFSFDFTSSDPRITMIGFDSTTAYNSAGFTLNLQPNTGSNSFQYSEQLDNAYWSKVRSSISVDAIAGPGGTVSADGLVGDATNNTHYITEASSLTVTQDQAYTFSVYAKQGANDAARIQLAGARFATNTYVEVDLTDGSVAELGNGADGALVEDVGDGWYRISVTGTAVASGNATMEMYSMNGINTVYTGDGATVDTYFYGAQLEEAPASASYVDNLTALRASYAVTGATTDPNGGSNAIEIVPNTVNSDHGVYEGGISVTSGETYEYTAFLKAGVTAQTRARLTLSGGFAANTYVNVNLNTGALIGTGAGATSATIESAGNGWYKVKLTATATSTTTTSAELRPVDPSTGLAFAGDGVSASTYAYGMKLVPSTEIAGPADYVPTTTAPVTGLVATANVDGDSSGLDDGSVSVANNVATILSGDAEGLRLFFDGYTLPGSVTFSYTVGVGAEMFFEIEKLLDESTGLVETEIEGLQDTNTISEDRITEMLARIEIQRQSLLERFISMETALATANRVLESISRTTDAMFGSKN